jgi:phosphate transport system permease protein
MGIHRGHRARPAEWLAEKFIFLVSLTAILMVFLIFIFVAREALPILFGQMNSAAARPAIPAKEMDRLKPEELREYLGLTAAEFKQLDKEALQALMEVREEEAREAPKNPDAQVNTTQWRYLLGPHQWADSRPEERYVWQPVGRIHKYNLVPLIIGSLKTTLVALLFSVPLALAAAIYVSQLASPSWKEWLKPAIELLSGVPSVVLGFFALIVMATFLQGAFGYESRLNAFVAGIALGLAVIPVVFSIAEDALTSVPRTYSQAALALGASKWQAAWL